MSQATCGVSHTVCVDDSGTVMSMGLSKCGRLGSAAASSGYGIGVTSPNRRDSVGSGSGSERSFGGDSGSDDDGAGAAASDSKFEDETDRLEVDEAELQRFPVPVARLTHALAVEASRWDDTGVTFGVVKPRPRVFAEGK